MAHSMIRNTIWIIAVIGIIAGIAAAEPVYAQTEIEQAIPGKGKQVDFVGYIQALFSFGLQIVVITASIYIIIGSYGYMTAGGNASLAEKGKEIINRSLIGLLLALVGWILLNTIHPQFAQELREPKLQLPAAPQL